MNAISFRNSLQPIRAKGGEFLDESALRRHVPSAFATEAHDSRSGRYAYIPTSEVISGLAAQGFRPVYAAQSRSRDAGKIEHTKHLIRFRQEGQIAAYSDRAREIGVGGVLPEIALLNSHDGSSAYQLHAGLLRLICLNGCVVDSGQIARVSIPHMGNVVDRVIEGSFEVLEDSIRALDVAGAWSEIRLTRDQEAAYAEQAHTLRFGEDADTPIRPEQLLRARRSGDTANNLWTAFQRVQENAIRGGLTGRRIDPETRRIRAVHTREVRGVDGDIRINRALWRLTERMAELAA